ncbi:hypothetical protein [Fluviispira multicolorata]|uniref:Uncharacterized protein n=1 Tax=Fluviispira multicolorata TaxID=2654512 RepID=A0A833N489_9BACT|nr:hypothetical protein [Fluviispira multicolorata]KAB8030016.1 hypothetical protein GCL57_10795 [Fluviispira multicolorata]
MSRHKFSKSSMSNLSKFSLDKNYLFFLILFSIIYATLKSLYDIINWERDFLTFFSKDIIINNVISPSSFHMFLMFLSAFIATLIPAIILRFCCGIVLIKSQIKVQRIFSFFLTIIFLFTTQNDGFSFGINIINSQEIIDISKIINYIFLGFFIISSIIFFVNINENAMNRKIRIIFIFILIISYLIYDWKKTKDFRAESKNNIENSEIVFILENTDDTNINNFKSSPEFEYIKENFKLEDEKISLISNSILANYATMFSGLYPYESGIRNENPSNSRIEALNMYIQNNKNNERRIYISNIGNPSSTGGLIRSFDGGIHCDNKVNDIYSYSIIKNFNSFLIFIPNSLIIKKFPKALCLNSLTDDANLTATDIYTNINKHTGEKKRKILINILRKDIGETNLIKTIERINETIETENIKIKIFFIQPEKMFCKIIKLIKRGSSDNKDINLLTFSKDNFINNKNIEINTYFEYEEEIKIKNQEKYNIIDNRVTSRFNNDNILNNTIKRKFTCNNLKQEQEFSALYENSTRDFPKKIILKGKYNTDPKNCENQIRKSFERDLNLLIDENNFDRYFSLSVERI